MEWVCCCGEFDEEIHDILSPGFPPHQWCHFLYGWEVFEVLYLRFEQWFYDSTFEQMIISREVWSAIAFVMLLARVDANAGAKGSVTVMLQWTEMASTIALRRDGHILAWIILLLRALRWTVLCCTDRSVVHSQKCMAVSWWPQLKGHCHVASQCPNLICCWPVCCQSWASFIQVACCDGGNDFNTLAYVSHSTLSNCSLLHPVLDRIYALRGGAWTWVRVLLWVS